MRDSQRDSQFRKPRRNLSDYQSRFSHLKNLQEGLEQQKLFKPKLNSIKINRNKLPPDFFPRSQSMRKKVSNHRPSLNEEVQFKRQFKKAESQRNHISPEKTSFFGFFEQSQKAKKFNSNTMNLKRQFESREQPKRDKLYMQQRNLTPMTGIHRNDILDMFPASYDQVVSDAMNYSKKKKEMHMTPRKEHLYKIRETQQLIQLQDPELREGNVHNFKQIINISTSGGSQDMHNITFFNVKSTSFPPIYKHISST